MQRYDEEVMDEFLNNNGLTWERDRDVMVADKIVETAGRVCYMSFAKPRPGGNTAYLDHIKEVGHGSVLEHSVITMIFEGVSRSLTHELVRHRAGMAYSQLSQRYVDEKDCQFVVPPQYRECVEAYQHVEEDPSNYSQTFQGGKYNKDTFYKMVTIGRKWVEIVNSTQHYYKELIDNSMSLWPQLERKEHRQAARSVLPNATETKIVVTANCRAIRHFLEQRGAAGADEEIQNLAVEVLRVVKTVAPNLFSDYRIEGNEIVTKWRKV